MYIFVSDAKYTEFSNNQFKNMEYIREKERGFDYIENIYIPGMFEVEIPANVTKKIYQELVFCTFFSTFACII